MAVKVLIPTPLQKLTNGQAEVGLAASSVQGLIEELEAQYPGVQERLCDEKGNLRRFINIYVNGEDIRFLQGQETKIDSGACVSIVPAIAGG
jgi:molybdopterin converting factor small subunit